MSFVNKEKSDLARAVVRKLISEYGPEIEENEELVAFRVEAIVKNEDHKAVKGFSQGLFEILMAKMRLDKMLKEVAEAAFEDTSVDAMEFTSDDDDKV